MPRRNLLVLFIVCLLSLVCYLRVDRNGRILGYAMEQIHKRALEEVDEQELLQGAMEGMISRLDENSAYISPDQIKEFQRMLDQKFGGVGMEVMLDPKTKQLLVMSPLVGTPAYEAGIRAGDKILQIDGKSTQGMSLADGVKLMHGEPGESVELTIQHSGEEKPVTITVVRAIIQVDTVLGDTRNPDGSWNYFLEGHDRIGYLRINNFGERTGEEMAEALDWLEEHDMRALILDLRNDPGGILIAATQVCDLFLDEGVIVTTRDREGRIIQAFEANGKKAHTGFPMAVLVNQYSASASEIVAACLQDYQRAKVIGQRTYGKGTIQEILDLDGGRGVLKLTTASYWRPSGKNIHRAAGAGEDDDWGVTPDKGYEVIVEGEELGKWLRARHRRDLVPRPEHEAEEDAESYTDPQLQKAVEYLEQELKSGPSK